uniref:Calponin-homology (CH) domain-containing protein n=1 Tax=Cyprinus carpio TaxID=7962 RepID=A0A8C2AXM5_CYPCA
MENKLQNWANKCCIITLCSVLSISHSCEAALKQSVLLLNTIRPGLVKKINRLPTPVAALDNVALFLKGCLELGLKSSQLFDPGDLQDTSQTVRDIKNPQFFIPNVLINIYWLGRAANSSTTYNGPTLDLHKFEGLLILTFSDFYGKKKKKKIWWIF